MFRWCPPRVRPAPILQTSETCLHRGPECLRHNRQLGGGDLDQFFLTPFPSLFGPFPDNLLRGIPHNLPTIKRAAEHFSNCTWRPSQRILTGSWYPSIV